MQNFTLRVLHNNVMNVSDMMISFRSCLFRLSSPFLLPLHEAWFRVQFNRTKSVITAVLLSQLLFLFWGNKLFFCEKDRVLAICNVSDHLSDDASEYVSSCGSEYYLGCISINVCVYISICVWPCI